MCFLLHLRPFRSGQDAGGGSERAARRARGSMRGKSTRISKAVRYTRLSDFAPEDRTPRQNWGKFKAHKWGGFTGRSEVATDTLRTAPAP